MIKPHAASATIACLALAGFACRQSGNHRTLPVGTNVCQEIWIVQAAGAVSEDYLTVIDGKGHSTVPSLPRELAKIQDVLVSPAKNLALVVSVGEGHPVINVYRIADWFAPAAAGAAGVEPYRAMDPYPFAWSGIAWRSRSEVGFRCAGDYDRFDRASRRPGGDLDDPMKSWIWNVATDEVRPAGLLR